MTRIICILLSLTMFPWVTYAQGYDANWVFGLNCGLNFNTSTSSYYIGVNTFEVSASISDKFGNNLFYIDSDTIKSPTYSLLGDSVILTYNSCTNCALIIPWSDTLYDIFHIDKFSGCSYFVCPKLLRSRLSVDNTNNTIEVVINSQTVHNQGWVGEKVKGVRSASGEKWWVIAQGYNPNPPDCNKQLLVYEVVEESQKLFGFIESPEVCSEFSNAGEIAISFNGDLISTVNLGDRNVFIFDFDRCNGTGEFLKEIQFSPGEEPYGVEFSPESRFLYVSTQKASGGIALYQYDVLNDTLISIWQTINSSFIAGQLELGKNGKIYFATVYGTTLPPVKDSFSTHLGVIKYPDSIGISCKFSPFSFSLSDSSRSLMGLPNMPNYNLGATTIYQADAGVDTFYCIGDTIKAVGIGLKDTIPGVIYTWLNGVDSIQQHQPFALVKPTQSTWYYLELSDTSINGSCTSRIDSVFVEVRNCTGLNEYFSKTVKVYPNPVNSLLRIQTPNSGGTFSLYNLLGGDVLTQPLTQKHTALDVSTLPAGVYVYRIKQNGRSVYGKVVVE